MSKMSKIFLSITLCFLASVCYGFLFYKQMIFDINCGNHLKLAADANTVDMAQQQLEIALKYLEENKLTQGNTSIFWNTPQNDLGFWYKNLKSSYDELSKINESTYQLEKTNVLMKLRETLLDHGEKGDSVTQPENVYLYPHQTIYLFWLILSFCVAITGIVFLVVVINY